MRISVVTPCLNEREWIVTSIESVLDQACRDFEHIIVDGGSTDGTLEILSRFPHLRVIVKPEGNLYDALNEGIRHARGDIICHLNADDWLISGVFERMQEAFESSDVDIVTGGALVMEERDGRMCCIVRHEDPERVALKLENVTLGVPIINARFMRRDLYERLGLYDSRYRIAADRDFLIRAVAERVKEALLGYPVYCYRSHSGSLTIGGGSLRFLDAAYEHLEMAARWLQDPRMSEDDRRVLRAWHTEASLQHVVRTVSKGQAGTAVRTIVHAIAVDARALWRLPAQTVMKAGRYVRRSMRG